MKITALTIVTALAVGAALPASAQTAKAVPGDYLQLTLGSGVAGKTKVSLSGVGSDSADLDAGPFGAVAGGRSFASGLAVEAEALYLKNDIDTGALDGLVGAPLDASVKTYGVMVNMHYAAAAVGPLTASIGAGVGYGASKYSLLGESDSANGFMWQLIGGFSYPVTEKFSWDAKYRYVRGPKLDGSVSDGVTTYRYDVRTSAHVVAFGGRMKF